MLTTETFCQTQNAAVPLSGANLTASLPSIAFAVRIPAGCRTPNLLEPQANCLGERSEHNSELRQISLACHEHPLFSKTTFDFRYRFLPLRKAAHSQI